MAAKTAPRALSPPGGLHTAGIYADMSVDGPEIGTLVVVFDRAKNLPNRKTVGKQDPYCAARLGKEAKKTETDRRGGQTPRWDQELRFTVHDSADYHNLKVSVFNDDRKTDLIGETWVSLTEVLRHGGGQADNWHNLNFKGKYAGEIRIELTFYDSRPKEERPVVKAKKQSQVDERTVSQDHTPQGPKQMPTMKRRPVPQESVNSSPPAPLPSAATYNIPFPQGTAAAYNMPPREAPAQDPYTANQYQQQYETVPSHVTNPVPETYSRSLPDPMAMPHQISSRNSASHAPVADTYQYGSSPQDQRQGSTPADGYVNQPYHYHSHSEPQMYRDDKHQHLPENSHYSPQRERDYTTQASAMQPQWQPTPDGRHAMAPSYSTLPHQPQPSMQHTHSAPHLGSEHMHHPPQNADWPGYNVQTQPKYPQDYQPQHPQPSNYYSGYHGYPAEDNPPPPPPVHRNSAPGGYIPQLQSQRSSLPPQPTTTTTPRRPLHVSTHVDDVHYATTSDQRPGWENHEPRSAYEPSASSPYPGDYRPHRQNSADAILAYHQEQAQGNYSRSPPQYQTPVEPRTRYARRSNGMAPSPMGAQSSPYDRPYQDATRPRSYLDAPKPSPVERPSPQQSLPRDGPPSYKPQPISPINPRQQPFPQTPPNAIYTRKEVNSKSPMSATPQSDGFYSPDSFNALNPNATRSTPNLLNSKEPSPMYTTRQNSTNIKDTTPSKEPQPTEKSSEPSQGPIIGSDGRIKDPSDHLPLSSYAPEPEPKVKRPTTVVNVKNRFGPRDAPPVTPPSRSSPASAPATSRNTPELNVSAAARHRFQRASPAGGASSPLSPAGPNALNSPQSPPTIPPKLPIMGNASGIEDYEPGGSMAALSDELATIDIGPRRSGDVAKLRKNRFEP